jgi:hypothetical protein
VPAFWFELWRGPIYTMTVLPRSICIHHCTSQPYRFFGRAAELTLLEEAFHGGQSGVVAFIGPGGQGKTAIVQHWLEQFVSGQRRADGVFLWSFYRGKDADLCLRELYAYAERLPQIPEVSASYCVDHLLPLLRRECWTLILDGTEVVQHESGPWFGRFVHPELGRLIEELASAPLPGVVILTTRFPVPGLERRKHARVWTLGGLDDASACGLLQSLGVQGDPAELTAAAEACGFHAKAVELLGTYLVRFHQAQPHFWRESVRVSEGETASPSDADDAEQKVARVLAAYQSALPQEMQDILALATAFREPPTEERLQQYLLSGPVRSLLHETWGRSYRSFVQWPPGWASEQIQELVNLRLLERVRSHAQLHEESASLVEIVIDAHPLVRRAFEHVLGPAGRRQSALARAGFLRGRPDRRRPATLEQAREEIELFHAHCDAGLWNEADGTYVALDNPKHRFLAPALERDLLLRFFPAGDWRRPSQWPGFGRYRSLAICFELLGQFDEALAAYREGDAALRGDALIALGQLQPLLRQPQASHPWHTLWQAYRAHALCLAGQIAEAVALARSLVPLDIYEWVHVFECFLRIGELAALDLRSMLYQAPHTTEHRWAELARQRMRADYLRLTGAEQSELSATYEAIIEAYDRGGLPYERALTRLSYTRWLLAGRELAQAQSVNAVTLDLAQRFQMRIMAADAWELNAEIARHADDATAAAKATSTAAQLRQEAAYQGPSRP